MARNAAHFHVILRGCLATRVGCRSSVVEHSLGKGEVLSSILSGSTIKTYQKWNLSHIVVKLGLARKNLIVQERNNQPSPAGARDCGILYVAAGATYRAEAVFSARSVKAVWPEIPIAIKTDGQVDSDCFDQIDYISDSPSGLAKVRHVVETPFERTLFLDTDTCCLHPMPELFGILDRFDLAAAHEAGRFSTRWEAGIEVFIRSDEIPECFPEFNTGVMAFRRGAATTNLLRHWLVLCEEARRAAIPHRQDQPSFRRAIYESGLNVAVLPPEYNFRLVCSGFARGPIKLIHGRWNYGPIGNTPEQIFATLARTFNENEGPRTFVHALGMICGHGPTAIPYDDPKRTCVLGEIRPLDEVETLRRKLAGIQPLADGAEILRRKLAEIQPLADEAKTLRQKLTEIQQSNSWKLTRPLRLLKQLLHRRI